MWKLYQTKSELGKLLQVLASNMDESSQCGLDIELALKQADQLADSTTSNLTQGDPEPTSIPQL